MEPEELKAWRLKNGYTQQQLAQALSVDVMTISRWERKKFKIKSGFLSLALEGLEKKGGELKSKGTNKKGERKVKE